MKKLLCFLILGLLAFPTYAKPKPKPDRVKRQHHLVLSTGAATLTAKDYSVSPNVYNGLNFMAGLGQEGRKAGQLGILSSSFQLGNIRYSYGNKQRQMCYDLNIEAIRSWEIRKGHTTQLYLGGMYSLLAAFRLPSEGENNFMTYEVANSLGLAGIAEREFKLFNRAWQLRYRLQTPIFSYLIRPSYTGPYPTGYLKDGVYSETGKVDAAAAIQSGKIVSINRFFRLDSYFSLTYPLKKNANALRLTYNWDFYTSSLHEKKASIGAQALFFSLLINL